MGDKSDEGVLQPEDEEIKTDGLHMSRTNALRLNDFVRAKEFFMTNSTKTGISLYDHFSELIRKLLDNRAPENPVDFIEELSLNLKRYRFGMVKDMIQDSFYISNTLIEDANYLTDNWKKHAMWSSEQKASEGDSMGGFPNLLRLQFYLEQVNIGLPREEMFRIALLIRQLKVTRPISRIRFWGKIFGTEKNYYVVEVEVSSSTEQDTWISPVADKPANELGNLDDDDDVEKNPSSVPGAAATFQRAGRAVTNTELLSAYQQTCQLPNPPPNSAGGNPVEFLGESSFDLTDPDEAKEVARWAEYQMELMSGFPVARIEDVVEIPAEEAGNGLNRRIFYVCNNLSEDWVRLPNVTPQQIIISRSIRWFLTGNLNAKIRSVPQFPGQEGHYLRSLLARITAGTQVSPKGYFRTTKYSDADDDDDEEGGEEEDPEEEDSELKDDIVYPNKKFRPAVIADLANSSTDLWVHHTSYIVRQGRTTWINLKSKKKPNDDEEDEEGEGEEEEDEENDPEKEVGPALFSSLAEDKSIEATTPWTARASSTVFAEFQVATVKSNLWPGANALCTVKGKVENIYLGDGLKFLGRSYAPPIPDEPQQEYKAGPELIEIVDPGVEEEQAWLEKLQLNEIADIESKFVDNETFGEEEEEEDEDDDEEDDDD